MYSRLLAILYLCHIVKQLNEALYCSLLASLKVKVCMIYVIPFYKHLSCLKLRDVVNLDEISISGTFLTANALKPVHDQEYG